ncbi:MAG: hypothetical protein JRI80_05135 [Deltaproteobacteria bacterium]|nr:hypothetical protein [Deltaproteobacteria bacterium]
MAKKKAKLTDEVEKRLDEIFVEGENTAGAGKEHFEVQVPPLRELKSVILSIEWEISDEVMHRLLEEVTRLKSSYNGDRIMAPFFKMLDSLGRYIKKYKAKANPEAIKVLNSVYTALEKILSSDGLKEIEKETILLEEVQRFKDLKREIQGQKGEGEEKAKTGKAAPALVEGKDVSIDWEEGQGIPETVVAALHELRALIQSEFKALREEIQMFVDKKNAPKRKLARKGKK